MADDDNGGDGDRGPNGESRLRDIPGWGTPAAGEIVRLYGRNSALALVRDFLTRDERDGTLRNRRYPVVVFTGMRGTGKTALLTDLAGRLDQQVAYARVDCEGFSGGARDLLFLLAFDLNRQSGRYGTLPFPRLITGQIAITARLNLTERDVARDQMRQVLEEHQKTGRVLKQAVSEMLENGLEALGGFHGVPGAGPAIENIVETYGPDLVLGGLVATRRGRRLVLGKGQDWYGHQDRDLGRHALDVLVDLNRMAAHPAVEGNRREVAELLWAAFLADLRDSFQHSRRASSWTLNCVVLLDNVDTVVGHDFLDELVMARRQRAAYADDEPDPLTVIATSRGDLAERMRVRGEGVVPLAEAGYADYAKRSRTTVGRWWYPVLLPDLTVDEVGNMVSALELPGGTRRQITSAVHSFTRGHPGATRMLLDAVAEHPGRGTDLLIILNGPEPGILAAGRRTTEERLFSRLTEGLPTDAVEDLVTCAAARHEEAALRLAAESGLLTGMRGEDALIFSADLWFPAAPARPGSSDQLHPVLRRLLLRRLAARPASGDHPDWDRVFGWLKANPLDADDETGELYHALALGEVEHVTRWFAHALEHRDAADWLHLLKAVTRAPNRLDHQRPPGTHVSHLTRWADPPDLPLALIARLVAAWWICADPLSASHRPGLRRELAADLYQIATYSRKGLAVLRDQADSFRDEGSDDC